MRENNKFFYSYRYSLFLKALEAKLATITVRKKPVHELNIKTIGILFDATRMEDKMEVLEFEKILQRTGAKIVLMGYLDHDADTGGLSFKHFTNKDRSFSFIPNNNDIERFLSTDYDIIINADLSQCISLHYLAGVSDAWLKVGPQSELDKFYHLVLDTKDTLTIKQYISELISILNKVCFHGQLLDKRRRDSSGHPI
ncbi:MAG: hypothetical protein ABI761_12210 [Saprospiraceae bacterium]